MNFRDPDLGAINLIRVAQKHAVLGVLLLGVSGRHHVAGHRPLVRGVSLNMNGRSTVLPVSLALELGVVICQYGPSTIEESVFCAGVNQLQSGTGFLSSPLRQETQKRPPQKQKSRIAQIPSQGPGVLVGAFRLQPLSARKANTDLGHVHVRVSKLLPRLGWPGQSHPFFQVGIGSAGDSTGQFKGARGKTLLGKSDSGEPCTIRYNLSRHDPLVRT